MPAEELPMNPRPTTPVQDAMPTTRGLNFFLEDPNLEFVCSSVLARALAGDELEALAAQADRHGPVLRPFDERGRRVDEVLFHPAYHEMERLPVGGFGLAAR